LAVANLTVTAEPEARDKLTVNATVFDPELPSATDVLTGLIETTGGDAERSSLVIVTVDLLAAPRVAPDGADSVTVNVSSASTVASPATATLICLAVWPALNVTVPEAAV
jgi:hypothetical protein